MKVFTKNAELSREMARGAGRTGLVPTMGALHEGHLSLVKKCREECDRAVVSVFVNPTQFNDPNDLKNYPRTEEADLALLEKTGVDYVLMPSVEDIYPQKDTRVFDLGTTDKTMEGAHRPGHFNGVAQVVSRLFDIVRPERAYFGEKDFQQISVIRRMVEIEGFDIEIVACPIKREADGLALSSRNVRLTPGQRAVAPAIHRILAESVDGASGRSVDEVKHAVTDAINAVDGMEVEYYEIVNPADMQPIAEWSEAEGGAVGCVTVYMGDVRLIDNIKYPA